MTVHLRLGGRTACGAPVGAGERATVAGPWRWAVRQRCACAGCVAMVEAVRVATACPHAETMTRGAGGRWEVR